MVFSLSAKDSADRLGFRYSSKNALKTLQSHTATENYVDAIWAARNSKNNTEKNNASSS